MPSADVDAGVLLGFVPLIISTAQFEPQSAFDQGSRYSEPAPTVTMWLGVPTYFAANLHAAHARRAHRRTARHRPDVDPATHARALPRRYRAVPGRLGPRRRARQDHRCPLRPSRRSGHAPCAGRRPHRPRRRPARRRDRPSTSDARRGASHHGRHRRGLRVPAERSNTLLSSYTDWSAWSSGPWMGVVPGSPAWHLVYIASLCLMAACAALATHRQWRGTTTRPSTRMGRTSAMWRRAWTSTPPTGVHARPKPGATGRPRNYRAGRPACVRARHIQPRSSDLPALGLTGLAAAPRRGSSPVSCRHRRAPRP
jgi:hypothetical protein